MMKMMVARMRIGTRKGGSGMKLKATLIVPEICTSVTPADTWIDVLVCLLFF